MSFHQHFKRFIFLLLLHPLKILLKSIKQKHFETLKLFSFSWKREGDQFECAVETVASKCEKNPQSASTNNKIPDFNNAKKTKKIPFSKFSAA